MVLWQAVFLAASPLVTAPPSNLTRLYYNGSAAKSHSTTTQYRQLRRLLAQRATQQAIFDNQRQPVHGSEQSSKFVSENSEQVRSNLFYSPQTHTNNRSSFKALRSRQASRWKMPRSTKATANSVVFYNPLLWSKRKGKPASIDKTKPKTLQNPKFRPGIF